MDADNRLIERNMRKWCMRADVGNKSVEHKEVLCGCRYSL